MTTTVRGLTAREHTVALRLAVGRTCAEVGEELDIATKTVDTHRGHILKKLKLRNNVELAHWALRTRLVDLLPENANA